MARIEVVKYTFRLPINVTVKKNSREMKSRSYFLITQIKTMNTEEKQQRHKAASQANI